MKKNKKLLVIIIVLLLIGVLASLGIVSYYKQQPSYVLDTYMRALNNRNYETAMELYYPDQSLKQIGEPQLKQFLTSYFEGKEFIKVEKGRSQINNQLSSQDKQIYEVNYQFTNQAITSTLAVIKGKEGWKIVFPFKIEDVIIYTPMGCRVWFNEKPVKDKVKDAFIVSNVLPGKYMVRIAFPNGICSDYITHISVPAETEVITPYQTVEVSVDCMAGTVVELGGEKMINHEGTVIFKNVLEGTYPLQIYDESGNIEQYEETIIVSKKDRQFKLEDMSLSTKGSEKLNQTINRFYSDYLKGIKGASDDFFDGYTVAEKCEGIKKEFSTWFIEGKTVKNTQLHIELNELKVNADGTIGLDALEIVELINEEKDVDKQTIEQVYRVTIRWDMTFKQEGGEYKLMDREIKESLVACKDKEGKWVSY